MCLALPIFELLKAVIISNINVDPVALYNFQSVVYLYDDSIERCDVIHQLYWHVLRITSVYNLQVTIFTTKH